MEYKEIPGLTYMPNAISQEIADKLINFISNAPWQTSLKDRYSNMVYITIILLGHSVKQQKFLKYL